MPSGEYMSHYRDRTPEYKERNGKMNAARGRADRRLRQLFFTEWLIMYKEELKKEGIDLDAEG